MDGYEFESGCVFEIGLFCAALKGLGEAELFDLPRRAE